ncbi:hypothetical protein D3C87_1913210 [compost metagenome]
MSIVLLAMSKASPVAVTWAAANVENSLLSARSGTISGGALRGSEPTMGRLAPYWASSRIT